MKPFTMKSVWNTAKQLILAIAVMVTLVYTGLLSGVSNAANYALLEMGLMDVDVNQKPLAQTFDYNFTVSDLKDERLDINALRGKVIFLNLWATWCGPCRAEMPSIQELYDSVDHNKVAFVMLSIDNPEQQAKVERYIKDKQFSFPVYMPSSELPKLLKVRSIPTTFVIGVDGKVKLKHAGTANYATKDFREFLNDLAAQPSPN